MVRQFVGYVCVLVLLASCTLPSALEPHPQPTSSLARSAPTLPPDPSRPPSRNQLRDPATQGTVVDQRMTVGNATLHIPWAYANRDQLIVGYVLTSADGQQYAPDPVAQMDEADESLTITRVSEVRKSDWFDVAFQPGTTTYVVEFARVPSSSQQTTADVRMQVGVAKVVTLSEHARAPFQYQPATNAGPFTMEFRVDVDH